MRARLSRQLGEELATALSLGAIRHEQQERQILDAAGYKHQESQRRQIGPVSVIDRQDHGRPLGQVRQEPIETVEHDEGRVASHCLRLLRLIVEHPDRAARRASKQLISFVVARPAQGALQELTDHPKRELRLEFAAARAQTAQTARGSAASGCLDEAGLADPGWALNRREPRTPLR